jgi:hypothetical protein
MNSKTLLITITILALIILAGMFYAKQQDLAMVTDEKVAGENTVYSEPDPEADIPAPPENTVKMDPPAMTVHDHEGHNHDHSMMTE